MAFKSFLGVLVVLVSAQLALAATVTYNWDVTWVSVNPDGRKVRPAVGINGQWPCPTINVNVGDRLIVNLVNKLGNETTSIHWHGLKQQGSSSMDGPVGVTQCPIPPGGSFTYDFVVNQPGTYWYHSHDAGQYPDGFRGPLIVHDPNSPYLGHYDEEIVLTLTDWYHDEMPILLSQYLSAETNPDGGEPIPYSNLLNEAQNIKLNIQPGKTYFVRVINMGAFGASYLQFDQHQLTIIEIDGVYTEQQTVDSIYVAAAQRYGVLLTAKHTANKNYAFLASFDLNMFDPPIPNYLEPNVTGHLVYNNYASLPPEPVVQAFNTYNDFDLIPYDQEALLPSPDQIISIDFLFQPIDGQNRATMNNVTYVGQIVPSLYTALTTGADAANPIVYGVNSNPYVLRYNSIVEIRLNNLDNGGHPFHLHGHQFQVVARSGPGVFPDEATSSNGTAVNYSPTRRVPMRRDTVQVSEQGYVVLRFKADNPGVFLFHCHIEWHVEAGLTATMIEAPLHLQQQQSIPPGNLATCKADGTPTSGNAAGNTHNFLNLTGANTSPPPNPSGALV
ncbi:hypothetical protein MMC19_005264 [Ptychographa xylographoides]|nr:hypothetical protein [Ptychographa xylographoides]